MTPTLEPAPKTLDWAHKVLGEGAPVPEVYAAWAATDEAPAEFPNPLTGTAGLFRYSWAQQERTQGGYLCGGTTTFRITARANLPAFFEHVGLAPAWHQLQDGAWWAELRLGELEVLASALDEAGEALGATLRFLAPLWRARVELEGVSKAYDAAAAEAARAAEAQELGLDVADLETVRVLARAVARVGPAARRGTQAYKDEVLRATAKAWTLGVRVGDTSGPGWLLPPSKDAAIAVQTDEGSFARDVATMRGERYGGQYHVVVDQKYALVLTRRLESAGRFQDAVNIRIALLAHDDPLDVRDRIELSYADTLESIRTPALREKVEEELGKIVFAPGKTPRSYQEIGVIYAGMTDYRCLIGDSPGLGKTVQAIGILSSAHERLLPALVVCPASVTHNWAAEFKAWAPWFKVLIVEGTEALPPSDGRTVYIMTWDMLARQLDEVSYIRPRCVVFDESQMAKHPQAARSQAAVALAQTVPHRILLSGTALENRSRDLFNQLRVLDPVAFPSLPHFREHYLAAGGIVVRGVKYVDDEEGENLDELAHRLRPYMIRRLKSQVLAELPDKTRSYLWFSLSGSAQKAYAEAQKDVAKLVWATYRQRVLGAATQKLRELQNAQPSGQVLRLARQAWEATTLDPPAVKGAQHALADLGRLRRYVGQEKAAVAVGWLKEHFAERADEPVIVFVEHREALKIIATGVEAQGLRWTHIDGQATKAQRRDRVQAFQDGHYDVIIGTQAMHLGVTLTRASNVLFVERWWVPAREEQAEDRAHRLGQRQAVLVTYLMAKDTVDTAIHKLVDRKRSVVVNVMGSETVAATETEGVEAPDIEGFAGRVLADVLAGPVGSKQTWEAFVEHIRGLGFRV